MKLLDHFFSKDDLEEISVLKELCKGISVNGSPFICFEVLEDIFQERYKLSQLSRERLLRIAEQLQGYNDFWKDVEWYNNQKMHELLPKFKKIIMQEIASRYERNCLEGNDPNEPN
ncbi:hypothetical protein [Brevibacillus brevis]|uniref:hypothetical protein n=1 Tax=Brevibacillus brevis TaxID=1393 RepID=UPI000D10EB15|nr:hypothetical protein [Brevibacillus brevis]PSJ69260.1 hypothetical protein C7J99_11200 [Brevibacillus brevis]RED27446.1 hypothetical protein DES34_110138 [Brevibacillus brevis]GEC90797.1 hypothetical protein BBR01nite_31280 [Brevibacillus brevis]VEF91299.1 Uncharacterised protein [Brevibacillus brevis]